MANYWFVSTKYRHSSKLALITFMLAFIVILLGAYTRLTNAGLSCPDWPHCYGFMTAPHTDAQLQSASQLYPTMPINITKAWTEMTHRYFAGTEGILILILSFSILLSRRAKDMKAKIIGFALIGLLTVQVTLGMLTVTEKLRPVIVLSHLLTGLSILSLLWWTYLELHLRDDFFIKPSKKQFTPWLWLGLVVIATQITLGGWVSTHYAGLACIDFPYCNGKLIPAMQLSQFNTDLITIHMLHRIGAFVTALYFLFLAHALLRDANFRIIGVVLLLLLATQISLGILNIVWLRPVWIALPHQFVATLILLTTITALVKASFVKGNRYVSWST